MKNLKSKLKELFSISLKNSLYLLFIASVFIAIGYLRNEDPARALFLWVLLLLFLGISYLLKSFVLGAIVTVFLWLPFNVTFAITKIDNLDSAYVRGTLVNYLIPSISAIDLGFIMLLVALLLHLSWNKISLMSRGILLMASIYLLGHNLYFDSVVTVFMSVRVILYLSTLLLSYDFIKSEWSEIISKRVILTKLFVVVLTISTLFQGILGALQFKRGATFNLDFLGESKIAAQLPGSSFVDLSGDVFLRAYGSFPHPNLLGGFLLLSSVIFLIMWRKKLIGRNLAGISIVAILFFSLFTFSRTVILLIVINLFIFTFMVLFEFKKRKINSPTLSSFISLSLIKQRFVEGLSGNDLSLAERFALINVGTDLLMRYPIAGVGIGLFTEAMSPMAPITGPGIPLLQPVHNIFLLILVENGLVFGSAILILLAMYLVKSFAKSADKSLVIPLLLFIVVTGMFDHYLITLSQGLAMFTIALILVGILSKADSSSRLA